VKINVIVLCCNCESDAGGGGNSRTVYILQGEGRGSDHFLLGGEGTVYFRGGSLTPEYVVLGGHFTPE